MGVTDSSLASSADVVQGSDILLLVAPAGGLPLTHSRTMVHVYKSAFLTAPVPPWLP